MRFSVIAALCAAPLVLAGFQRAELAAHRVSSLEVRDSNSKDYSSKDDSSKDNNSKDNKGKDDKGRDYKGNNDNNILIEQSTTIEEIIIIWVNNGGTAATSTVTDTATAAAGATQSTHTVTVGGSAGLVYTPDTIEAAVGDMVIFTFQAQNHTASQSAFTTPCEKLEGGVDSGFMANINGSVSPAPQMAMQVKVSTPIWFYCRQKGHCGKGMTFSINPTAAKTQAEFQQQAIAQNGTGTASPITGGSSSAAAPPPSSQSSSSAAAPPPSSQSSSADSSSSNSGGTSIVQGSGTFNAGGSCDCSCLCGVTAFPNAAVQGVGGYGGYSGGMPMIAAIGS